MKKTIDLCYITEAGERHQGEIDRAEILGKMEDFKKGYPDNNEISTKLVKLLPQTQMLLIDKRLKIDEMPAIVCSIEGEIIVVKIQPHHKQIWGCLDEYGEKIKNETHKS